MHREATRLAILILAGAAAFAGTRALAQRQRAVDRADAATWLARGDAARLEGNWPAAAELFRRAALLGEEEIDYVLPLAEALSRTGHRDAAARALLRVRARTPDDPIVNRALARVYAAQRDVANAVRYYQNALYGSWPTADGPRQVRLELIDFLLDNGEPQRAVAELIAATTDLPKQAAAHLRMARLFAAAGDAARASAFYASTLQLEPANREALEGAIEMAFQLGEYARLARFSLPTGIAEDSRRRVEVARLVVSLDPLARRIGAAERRRRVLALVDRLRQRDEACGNPIANGAPQLTAIGSLRLDRPAAARDPDILETALRLLARATRELDAACGPPMSIDVATLLIARLHGMDES